MNKNVRFKCESGNAVWFKPVNGEFRVTIKGVEVLLDDCALTLVGAPRPGQCVLMTNPSTGIPPCAAAVIPGGNWVESTTVHISGKRPLSSRSYVPCPICAASAIKPFKPTLKIINVDSDIDNISVNISAAKSDVKPSGTDEKRQNAETSTSDSSVLVQDVSIAETDLTPEGSQKEIADKEKKDCTNALCSWEECDRAAECAYLKTSHEPPEADESKNAAILKANMAGDTFDSYVKICRTIETLSFEGNKLYSTAHHHLIPVNQCFRAHPKIVKLANYYGYDINSALNGVCLPMMTEGYQRQSAADKRRIAFKAMEALALQWHVGPHQYSLPKAVAEQFRKTGKRGIRNYKDTVDDMLIQFESTLRKTGCRLSTYSEEAETFRSSMDHISKKILKKVLAFSGNPQNPFCIYVSKMAFYFAFYDELREYEDILFREINNDD